MKLTASAVVAAPIADVWRARNSPEDIKARNSASPDWHTTAAAVDRRVGGKFSSRMEAIDGSAGFDSSGEYSIEDDAQALNTLSAWPRSAAGDFKRRAKRHHLEILMNHPRVQIEGVTTP